MMRYTKTYYLLLVFQFFGMSLLFGQISPGKLSEPHAHLEGMGNCTQCHDLGNKVPDQKCLACHVELQSLIDQNRGYHVSNEVKSKDCVACHNEHHGRKFDVIRFNEEDFDHALAGYILEGKHKVTDCRECHKSDHINDLELKKRKKTFLGLNQDCLSCHDDFHQQTLSNDCVKCHNFDHFRPADNFNHSNTAYALKGAHMELSCLECHPNELRNGIEFQVFTGLGFADCISCHDDPHNKKLPGSCSQCHSESSFSNFQGERRFDHNQTEFTLKGSHAKVSCFDCHQESPSTSMTFQNEVGIQESNCIACHTDVHDGKFGLDCSKCHTEESFTSLKSLDFFNHNLTDYAIEGQHIGVDCRECHPGSYIDPIEYSTCNSCHEDYHKGEFVQEGGSPDCNNCHVLEEKFDYTTFGLEEHESADFILDGAHIATPCFACHVSEDHWSFREIGKSCIDCHDNIHKDYISQKYLGENDCTQCHETETWQNVTFDHALTEWPLTGEHLNVDCRVCHFVVDDKTTTFKQTFKSLPSECIQCHKNIHGDQFVENGSTECVQCHDTESWFPNAFNHNNTAFPLDGKHAELRCDACHKSDIRDSNVLYKIEKFECIDCHS